MKTFSQVLSVTLLSSALFAIDAPPQVPGFSGTQVSTEARSGSVTLLAGWNLVGSPVDGTISTSKFNEVASQSGGKAVVWALKQDGSNWETVGGVMDLEPGRGVWVLSDTTQTVTFSNITPSSVVFDINTYKAKLSGGAYQLSTPTSTTLGTLIPGASSVWLFDTAANNWIGYSFVNKGGNGFDSDGYYRGSATTAAVAGTGYWYLP